MGTFDAEEKARKMMYLWLRKICVGYRSAGQGLGVGVGWVNLFRLVGVVTSALAQISQNFRW